MLPPMNLTLELETFLNEFAMRVPLPRQRVIDRAVKALVASALADRALGVGALAPDFTLLDERGASHRLQSRLEQGTVVLLFFRGVWCPFCNLMLRAYQEQLPTLTTSGAQLLAVSPQSAAMLERTRQRNRLQFPLLSDPACHVAAQYGLAYALDEELASLYRKVGHPLPAYNASADWLLPMPAVYVIGGDGRILYARVEPDFRRRTDPDLVVRALAAIDRDAVRQDGRS